MTRLISNGLKSRKVLRVTGWLLTLIMVLTFFGGMPMSASAATTGPDAQSEGQVLAAAEPEVINIPVSEDAHFQMWNTQAPFVYGNTRFLKVTRPGSDTGNPDPTMGLFGELYTGGQVTTIDGSSSFLKFSLSEDLRAKLAESNVEKAELIMRQFNRRYSDRETTANLVVRRVSNNWNEANDHSVAGGDNDRSSYNYMRDPDNGIFVPATAETAVARSEVFTMLGSGTNNWNSNNGSGKSSAMPNNNLGNTNQDIVTDITSVVSGISDADTVLNLAVNQEGSGNVIYFVSKEGGSTGGLSGADASMIPTLRLTLAPAAVSEDMAAIELERTGNGTVTADFTVARAADSTGINALGILAFYDENGMLLKAEKLETEALAVAAGAPIVTASLTAQGVPNSQSVKAFLWDADTYIPLCAGESRAKIEEVTFTASADGATGTATTTKIDLVFDKPITGLTADDITITPADAAVKGALTGSGTNWSLAVTDVTAGEVTVSVADFENFLIEPASYGADRVELCVKIENIAFTATADGSETAATRRINLVFDKPVIGLTADVITLSPARAVKGALTGSGTEWTLALSEVTAGAVTVSIASFDIFAFAPASETADEVMFYYTAPLRDPVTGNEWNEITVAQVNQLDSRAMIIPFGSAELAKANPTLKLAEDNSDDVILLNGTWKFNWVAHHSRRTSDPATDGKPDITGVTEIPETGYFDITVPSSWQTNMQYAGWKGRELDWPMYANTAYPWTVATIGGTGASLNGGQPAQRNPVGTYMRYVDIAAEDLADNRFIISFLGVEAGFFLYVNGEAVGYGEDSFTSSEFDITDLLVPGRNLIATQVYKFTTGSWLENQDTLYYAGMHRDVYITKQPKVSIFDYNFNTEFPTQGTYMSSLAKLTVDVENTSGADAEGYSVTASLYDADGTLTASMTGDTGDFAQGARTQVAMQTTVSNPKLWSAEFPNLYTLVMELKDENGITQQAVSKRVGFREIALYNKGTTSSTMTINGQPIKFYGVNRGEADPRGGHHVPYDVLVKDVQNAKLLNVNSFRTSHYPSDPHFYEICDEYGAYIMDEANVETHNGRTNDIPNDQTYANEVDRDFPGNDRRFQNAMLDRMSDMVMRDRNNPSVVMYSLGNECGFDATDPVYQSETVDPATAGNFNRMITIVKKFDPEGPIHLQQSNGSRRIDIHGEMYPGQGGGGDSRNTSWGAVNNTRTKPYLTMEIQHSMGNTTGDYWRYIEPMESSYRTIGSFIWDYVEQSAYTPKNSIPNAAQGGQGGPGLTEDDLFFGFDNSWINNSGNLNFCVNGFIRPDRTWNPGADEVKQEYQELKFTQIAGRTEMDKVNSINRLNEAKQVRITNNNRFKNANYYDITWALLEDGVVIQSGSLAEQVNLPPAQGMQNTGSTKVITIPYEDPETKPGAEYLVNIEYKLKQDELWADAGYVQGQEQFRLPELKGEDKNVSIKNMNAITTNDENGVVTITGTTPDNKPFTVAFNKASGLMTTYNVDGNDLISRAPVGSFFRPETDQNVGVGGSGWGTKGEAYDARWYEQGENMTGVNVTTVADTRSTVINVSATLQNGSGYAVTYTVYGNGRIDVATKLTPSGSNGELGEVGMWMKVPAEYEQLTWYGRGPGETYWDRKGSNPIGKWSSTVEDRFHPYLRLQETGNMTDVRWLALRNAEGVGLLASMTYEADYEGQPMEAVALHYEPKNMSTWRSKSRYPYQAVKSEDVVLRLLHHQKGVGNLDWSHNPQYAKMYTNGTVGDGSRLENTEGLSLLESKYTLMPLFANSDPMALSKEIPVAEVLPPMVSGISVDGTPLADFEEKVRSYDYPLGANDPWPVVTATTYDGVTSSISQASNTQFFARIDASLGEDETSYQVNFIRDLDFITGITVNGGAMPGFNKILRSFTASVPTGVIPVVAVTLAAGLDAGDVTIVQPTEEDMSARITVTNDYGATQVYTIDFMVENDFDDHRPAAWEAPINIQTFPLGDVLGKSFTMGSHAHYFYYINNTPTGTGAGQRGDLPFVGLYPGRRLANPGNPPAGTEGVTADKVQLDPATDKKVYVHKNFSGSGGSAVGDAFVGVENQNTTNIAGRTMVMYAKFKPVSGVFAIAFRDGNQEARNANEVIKVQFSGTGTNNNGSLGYSTATAGQNASAQVTTFEGATGLRRDTYYEMWITETPDPSGHRVTAYIRYTNAQGDEVTGEYSAIRTGVTSNTVNWPVFFLTEGNATAEVWIEDLEIYTVNEESPLITYEISGARDMVRPAELSDPDDEMQLSARVIHSAEDRFPLPLDPNLVWEIPQEYTMQGLSIDQTGLVKLARDFTGDYFEVIVKNADPLSTWLPKRIRIDVVNPE